MKKQNGITLISLIITIIIMLILAGVSLSMVMGDGSMLEQANSATENTRGADIKEYVDLAVSSNKIGQYSGIGIKNKTVVIQELIDAGKLTDADQTTLASSDVLVIGNVTIDFSVLPEGEIQDQTIATGGSIAGGSTDVDGFMLDNFAYPMSIGIPSDLSNVTFYIKEKTEPDTSYTQAVAYWTSGGTSLGSVISQPLTSFASAVEYIAIKVDNVDTVYNIKVKNIYTDGSVKYGIYETPEGVCFVSGTEVLTENGLVNIEDITAGMKVYSKNFETDENELKKVLSVSENKKVVDIYSVYVDGECIESTDVHPYYVKEKGFVKAKDLNIGDVLVDANGSEVVIENIVVTNSGEETTVYNMNVEDNHNYYVSEMNILVHNSSCPL